MNRYLFRLGRLAVLSAIGAALLATVALADASAAVVKPGSCPTDKPLVVDSYFTAENSADTGPDGHVWALDAGTRFIRIWHLAGDAYCMQLRDVGTFTSFAGLSPEGTGTVRGGVTGSSTVRLTIASTERSRRRFPRPGRSVNFDVQCSQDGTCAGAIPSASRSYFSPRRHLDPGAFTVTYNGGACGNWYQSNSGDTGDIVC